MVLWYTANTKAPVGRTNSQRRKEMSEEQTQTDDQQMDQSQDQKPVEQQAEPAESADEMVSRKELEAVLAKNKELLSEKKKVAERARELEYSQRKAEEERLKQNEEFKELYERTQAEKDQLAQQFETHKQAIQRKELEASSYKVATALTRDTARAELLAEKAASFAKHTDDALVYEIGGVEVNSDQLQKHLAEKYPFLVDGSGATGGGAAGTQRPSGVSDVNQAAQDAKKKGDLTGFITAQLKT